MPPDLRADHTDGELTLHLGRAGRARLIGHDLTLRLAVWSGSTSYDEATSLGQVRVVTHLPSLEVLHGKGGLAPLSARDKATILAQAMTTLRARNHPEVVFEAFDVPVEPGEARVAGHMTLAGVTRPQVVHVAVDRASMGLRVQARAELLQSDFGITPYSTMLGALRVSDLVKVRADFTVGAALPA